MSEREQVENADGATRRSDFEERWRQWARRPPKTRPQTAAHRVLRRLAEPSPRPRRRSVGGWASPGVRRLVAAALVLAAVGLWLLTAGPPFPFPASDTDPHPGPGSEESPGRALAGAPAMADGVVLMWLDAETPLYMTFAPPARAVGTEKGEGS